MPMRYVLAFLFLGLALAADALRRWPELNGFPSIATWFLEIMSAVTFLVIATVYGLAVSGRSTERAFGGIHPVALALLPYQAFAAFILWASVRLGREDMMNEVVPGVYLGRLPFTADRSRLEDSSIGGVLQLCAEFPNLSGLWTVRRMEVVILPILDGLPPSADQFSMAIKAVAHWRSEGRIVLIHCAQGHGRGAVITAAILVACGFADEVVEALEIVRRARPGARPSKNQTLALARYFEGHAPSGSGGNERIC